MGSCCSSASRGQGEASPLPTLTGSNTGSSCDSLAATGAAGRVDHCEQQGSGVTAPSEVEGGPTPACVPTLRSGLVESVEATPPAATAVPIEQIEFYFLDAKKLLELDRLPTLTDGRKIEGLVKKEPINLNGIIRGEYTSNTCGEVYLAISHRWERPQAPDPSSQQLNMLINYLRNDVHGKLVTRVWYDYSCMWQGERTEWQDAEFRQMLADVNFLYLGCRVLILADLDYNVRFWCCYEAWLSFQRCTKNGLIAAKAEKSLSAHSRNHVLLVGDAWSNIQEGERLMHEIVNEWSTRNLDDAMAQLGKDFIHVTNQSDRATQLKKLPEFEDRIKKCLSDAEWDSLERYLWREGDQWEKNLLDLEAQAAEKKQMHLQELYGKGIQELHGKGMGWPTCQRLPRPTVSVYLKQPVQKVTPTLFLASNEALKQLGSSLTDVLKEAKIKLVCSTHGGLTFVARIDCGLGSDIVCRFNAAANAGKPSYELIQAEKSLATAEESDIAKTDEDRLPARQKEMLLDHVKKNWWPNAAAEIEARFPSTNNICS